ncbi:siderophore-interacting protein [Hansschlegelia plantiphila]|uniref:FAD-binding FR-type domain-containing protein n=1 Tax=Hansschlegelia plantiphila TaxID=374655 RepID=A0A9W6MW36_9HYPH|nr:siderophore-interacting protein [Hansschlegelia plantiphila]GLK69069.1 hypothetical protein GCM10008179_27070 [Hansschlegelia plantiphila]
MLPVDSSKHRSDKVAGRLSRALLGLLMKRATVVATKRLTDRFRLITLEGSALEGVAWTPGLKIQIAMGSAFVARTYTPIEWDIEGGRTQILTFAHGDGPGSRWASGLSEGDTCQFFGPRRSIDLSDVESPVVLFGDETSFGLAAALCCLPRGADAIHVFEVSDVAESRPVLEALGLGQAVLIQRIADDAHLAAAEAEALRFAAGGAHFVLTGKASSIQRISRTLKAADVRSSRVKTKAYWAQGKVGLD